MLAAFDTEFGFPRKAFDFTAVVPVCAALVLSDVVETACPRLGRPFSCLNELLANPDITIAVHHVAAEWHMLQHLEIPFPARWIDTECAQRFLDITTAGELATTSPVENCGPYSLLACRARRGLRVRESWYKAEIQQKVGSLKFADHELPRIVDYCVDDCRDTLELAEIQLRELASLPDDLGRLYFSYFQPYLLKITAAAARGVCFDRESYGQIIEKHEELLSRLQGKIRKHGFQGMFRGYEKLTVLPQNLDMMRTFTMLGMEDVISSLPIFKRDFNKIGGWKRRSLANVFKNLTNNDHAFLHLVSEYHSLIDLIRADWRFLVHSDGKLRPSFVFPGTSSFRTMPHKPHLLQLPKSFRPLIHASAGNALVECDFSCEEIGLAAAWFGDKSLATIFNTYDKDLYAEIGFTMGQYPSEDPDADPVLRDKLKTAILAIAYGGGVPAIMENIKCSESDAGKILASFKRSFPDLYLGRDLYLKRVQQAGFAQNVLKLRRHYEPFKWLASGVKDTTLSYLNYPVQSAGSLVMMEVFNQLPKWTQPLIGMHDAILLECPVDAVADTVAATKAAMARAMNTFFPTLRCRTKAQAAFRYYKSSPDSLHKFCARFGETLTADIGWRGKI